MPYSCTKKEVNFGSCAESNKVVISIGLPSADHLPITDLIWLVLCRVSMRRWPSCLGLRKGWDPKTCCHLAITSSWSRVIWKLLLNILSVILSAGPASQCWPYYSHCRIVSKRFFIIKTFIFN